MAKAQVGDLIRIIDSDDAPKGTIYEVTGIIADKTYVNGVFDGDGSALFFFDDEYEIFRKAGEEGPEVERIKIPLRNETRSTPTQDAVEHPNHYTQGRFETIEIIEEITQGYSDGYVAYCVGNALKYLARAPYKHETPLEDLRKAAKYLEFAIDRLTQ